MSKNTRPMTPKEIEELNKKLKPDEVASSSSVLDNYIKDEVSFLTIIPEKPNSGLFVVVKITLKDNKIVNCVQIGLPEYEMYALAKLRTELAKGRN